MQAHIPTIFLVIICLSFALAAAIAVVSGRHKQGLNVWAIGMALHGLGYLLFSMRGQISDFISIVIANLAISSMFALFTEGIRNFVSPQPRKWYVWAPVFVTAIVFTVFINDMHQRTILSAMIYLTQGLLLAYAAFQNRTRLAGQGQYIIVASASLLSLVMLVRLVGTLTGQFTLTTISAASSIQTLTFLISIVSTLLVVIGVLLMTWERDEQAIRESEIRMRTLFESTSDAVMLLDERGFFDCNAATLKMFGCPSKEVFLAQSPADFSPPTQPCGTDSELLAQQQMAKARRDSSNRFEWVHKRLDNDQTFPAEVLLNAMHINGRDVLQAVVRDITERHQLQLDLERQAHLDYLTGLHNRGYFMQMAEVEVARAIRYSSHLSLLMMDIDNFKKINDTHGHKAGDLVLKKLAEICQGTLREVDVIGRIGGEEFAVLLPETTSEKAMEVAERLRAEIAASKVGINQGLPLNFTVSLGVSTLTPSNENLDVLMSYADKALYAAKNSGKNKVCVSSQ